MDHATMTTAFPIANSVQSPELVQATSPKADASINAPSKLPEITLNDAEVPAKVPDMTLETLQEAMEFPISPLTGDSSIKSSKEKRKNLTDQQRVVIVHYLLANSAGGRLKHGDMKAAATFFGVHRATIRRLWKLHSASDTMDGLAGNVASRIKGHSGRKPKVPDEELKARIAAVPAERRMTGRGLSTALGVSNSVIVRLIKSGKLRRHPKKLHYIM
ncbi:uncharacterized protein PHALS_07877 [Plasmopara halstedii]|uniref:DUF7769 domain-containing protein n=1 Tax=Plasmopara halstedii TaxID=4781 RepID=A0A0P1B7P8_PLAHL|nr:uncharacterized protein PHALS_07877 [Plasmopara halstedii]CEG50152.1 hypothetical protein PHALS_07877 [Plasmopara halstedii]|eukprot:XP_024586521.1 hypothetical protein PHALS_07877 [Plasmopara halstedii]